MKRLAIVMMLVGLGACERSTPVAPTPSVQPQTASVGCPVYKTYQTCNAAPGCMWAGLPLGCIKRVE